MRNLTCKGAQHKIWYLGLGFPVRKICWLAAIGKSGDRSRLAPRDESRKL